MMPHGRDVGTRAAVLLFGALALSACAEKAGESTTPPATTASSATATPAREYPPGATTIIGAIETTDDGLRFIHCPTHAPYPIAHEGAYDELERGVAGVSRPPGTPVIVSLVGRLQPLPIVEGRPPRDQMIVDRVLRVWPDETCQKVGVQTPLRNTYWKLVELNGAPVATHEGQREVHLTLRIDGVTADGFAGCNRFSGRYEHRGEWVRFVGLASTPAACPYLEEEQAFLKALERVTSYLIMGESLDLRDDAGSVARCRAVYF